MASSVQTQEICGMCGDVITKNAKGSLYKAGAETIFKISENLKDGHAEKTKINAIPNSNPCIMQKGIHNTFSYKGKKAKDD